MAMFTMRQTICFSQEELWRVMQLFDADTALPPPNSPGKRGRSSPLSRNGRAMLETPSPLAGEGWGGVMRLLIRDYCLTLTQPPRKRRRSFSGPVDRRLFYFASPCDFTTVMAPAIRLEMSAMLLGTMRVLLVLARLPKASTYFSATFKFTACMPPGAWVACATM